MADQLAGQWYADATGLGDLVAPERVLTSLRTVFDANVLGSAAATWAPSTAQPRRFDRRVERPVGRELDRHHLRAGGLHDRSRPGRRRLRTAHGAFAVTYGRGLWFRTPEAYLEDGRYRAAMYLRPLAIWAIEHTLRQQATRER